MFLLKLDKEIYKNIKLGLKNLGKVDKNGPKHVLNLVWPQGSWIHQWRQGNFFIQYIVAMIYIYIYIYCSFNNKFQLVGSLNNLFYLLQICNQNYPFLGGIVISKNNCSLL